MQKSNLGKQYEEAKANMQLLGYDDEEEAFVLDSDWLISEVAERPELYSKYRIRNLIDMEKGD